MLHWKQTWQILQFLEKILWKTQNVLGYNGKYLSIYNTEKYDLIKSEETDMVFQDKAW